jgi:hypothetical protein
LLQTPRFDDDITVKLKRDEAIVLFWYLTRELWNKNGETLQPSFVHEAESHSLHALMQELIRPLMDTGAPDAAGIEDAAREHLLNRHR